MLLHANRFLALSVSSAVIACPALADVKGSGPDIRVLPSDQCAADIANEHYAPVPDGKVSEEDLLVFIKEFAWGSKVADMDDGSGEGIPDGGVTIEDLLYFLMHYAAGC